MPATNNGIDPEAVIMLMATVGLLGIGIGFIIGFGVGAML